MSDKEFEATVLKSVYESGVHQENPKVLKVIWKDGIDINEPSWYLMNFSRKLMQNAIPELSSTKEEVARLREALEKITFRGGKCPYFIAEQALSQGKDGA